MTSVLGWTGCGGAARRYRAWMRAFIIGGSGLVGRAISRRLLSAGWDVDVLAERRILDHREVVLLAHRGAGVDHPSAARRGGPGCGPRWPGRSGAPGMGTRPCIGVDQPTRL